MAVKASSSKSAPKRNIDLARRAQIGQEKRARTRSQIVEAAFALLGREDGLTTSIDEICEAASVSRGTFYNYFTSTPELFKALSYELSHDLNVTVTRIIDPLPQAAERVSAAVRYYLERALRDPKWAWAMVNISAGGPILGADTYHAAQRTAEQGISAGEFDLTSAESGRDLQLGMGLAAMISLLRGLASPNHAQEVATHVLRGLGVPRKRALEIATRPLPAPMID